MQDVTMFESVEEIVRHLVSGTVNVIPYDALIKKLSLGRKLRIKLGMDPTSPNLHLGHTLVLTKLREFQNLGHEVIFLIGDFTARIGDPTGKSATRPPLSSEDIAYNMQTYFDQVGSLLDMTKTSVRYNSEWLGKFTGADFVNLCGKVTLARIIERDDFQKRLAANSPIGFHELLYPLFQGYDSVALQADIELGGTDQTFNLLMGRCLQEQMGQDPQVIMTMPLLEGVDGVQKMSKSLGNAIGITEPASQAFGKLMSISDELMWRYYALLLSTSPVQIEHMKQAVIEGSLHPMQLKKDMAQRVVARFWSQENADHALQQFEALFQNKDYSQAVPFSFSFKLGATIWIVDLLKQLSVITTSSQAKSLIESGAIVVNGNTVADFKAQIELVDGMIIKAGKHKIFKINRIDE